MALARDHALVLCIELVLLVVLGVCTTTRQLTSTSQAANEQSDHRIGHLYAMFQDVHVMIYIGFGYLMTFLKRYGYSSLGFTFLVGAILCQWAVLCKGFFEPKDPVTGKIPITLESLLGADVSVAAVLISVGALIGKTSPLQLILMGLIELVICAANENLGVDVFKAVDAGESIFIHVFGAYFGLAVSRALHRHPPNDHSLEGANYTSDLFAMVGTVFLWLFWPSFNSAGLEGAQRERALINTYMSLAACAAVSFAISGLVSSERKFDMVHIQNATLAGGVAIGTGCNLVMEPYCAAIIGAIAGALSTFGYRYIQPKLQSLVGLHDTCGVHNLHGMPGVFAGLVGAAAALWPSVSSAEQVILFPATAPIANSTQFGRLKEMIPSLVPGSGRSSGEQAAYQMAALGCTLVIAIASGTITGFLLKIFNYSKSERKNFKDEECWEVPEIQPELGITNSISNNRKEEQSLDHINQACYDNPLHVIESSENVI